MKKSSLLTLLALACAAAAALLPGCATPAGGGKTAGNPPSGANLWAQNCSRCHNRRSPGEFSSAQWDIVMLHMRVRSGLTAQDSRAILEFLQTTD